MSTYWITFRIYKNDGYEQRRDALYAAINSTSTKWWVEPTSFIAFDSSANIDSIASSVKAAINPSTDLALIGMTDYKSARIVGSFEDKDIFDLMPFLKKG